MAFVKSIVCLMMLGMGTVVLAQSPSEYVITVDSKKPAGIIDEMLYGQLFEHIYFSANNGVWQELIQERSFEPEQYPGIHPRDGTSTAGIWMMTWCCIRQPVMNSR